MVILQNIFLNTEGRGDSYSWFEIFEVSVWRRECFIDNLFLEIQGVGHFKLEIINVDNTEEEKILFSENMNISKVRYIHIDEWLKLNCGFLSVRTKGDIEKVTLSWATDIEPKNHISLGLVITHFNRKQFVVPAIKRLQEELISKYDDISLIVVDNSQNITEEEACGVTVIKNENYGGSGGFTRGLLHLKDHGFTHCLFMDDDATCEIESILRAYRIFQYANDESIAVSGSLFDEAYPSVLIDKGGVFKKGRWLPLNNGIDLSEKKSVPLLLSNKTKIDYGGWWFFGFNIAYIKYFPFPTFVRGDDVLFSLDNKFNIVAPFGINCWAENFFLKEGPIQRYLDFRSTFLINITHKKGSLYYLLITVIYRFFRTLLTFHYESCLAILKAIEDFMSGPDFYKKNLDASSIFKKINAFTTKEKIQVIKIQDAKIEKVKDVGPIKRISKTTSILITLNGLYFPSFFKKRRALKCEKCERVSLYKVFLYSKIYYLLPDNIHGFILEEDKLKAVKLLARFIILILRFLIKYPFLSKEYKKAHEEMTSEKFWRDVYNL